MSYMESMPLNYFIQLPRSCPVPGIVTRVKPVNQKVCKVLVLIRETTSCTTINRVTGVREDFLHLGGPGGLSEEVGL